ncbi:MAG: hypothetical protein OXN26_05260, partial [Gammaproteobacteria bacterium]|nr:hypothetical protein [Gammaproteobacteria bacterium]
AGCQVGKVLAAQLFQRIVLPAHSASPVSVTAITTVFLLLFKPLRIRAAVPADGRGQSKITTGSAVANILSDFTLTPEFIKSLCPVHTC